jgi:hypothetical protein
VAPGASSQVACFAIPVEASLLESRRPAAGKQGICGMQPERCRASHRCGWRCHRKVCIVFRVVPVFGGAEILCSCGRFCRLFWRVCGWLSGFLLVGGAGAGFASWRRIG